MFANFRNCFKIKNSRLIYDNINKCLLTKEETNQLLKFIHLKWKPAKGMYSVETPRYLKGLLSFV